jgi:ProP effector
MTMRPKLAATDRMRARLSLSPVAPPPARPPSRREALVVATLARLGELFPAAFGNSPRPLVIGVAEQIMARTGLEPHAVRLALYAYCNSPSYVASLIEGAVRVDLDGNAAGTVLREQAAYARWQEAKTPESQPPISAGNLNTVS